MKKNYSADQKLFILSIVGSVELAITLIFAILSLRYTIGQDIQRMKIFISLTFFSLALSQTLLSYQGRLKDNQISFYKYIASSVIYLALAITSISRL